jgi:tetratricopeptide (TPR) repeat protein
LRKRLPKAGIGFQRPGKIAERQADVLMDDGRWRQALETLSKAESSYLQSMRGLLDLGRCHAGLAQWDDAEREFGQALEATSRDPPMQRWYMDRIWRDLLAWPQLRERVARTRPEDPWRWISSARSAVVDGRWSDAVEDYGRAAAPPRVWDSQVITDFGVEDSIDFQYGVSRLFADDLAGALHARDRLVEGDPRSEEFKRSRSNASDYNLLAAAHLQLLAPQGTARPAAIASWLRGDDKRNHRALLPLIYLRSGKFAQTLSEEQAAYGDDHYGRLWFSQAMAHHYLKHDPEARECLAKGKQWLDRRIKEVRINRRYDYTCGLLEAEVLRREAEQLILNEKPDGVGPQ